MKETYERPVNKTEFSFAEREDVVHFLRVTLQHSEIDMYIYRIAAGWMDGIPYQYQKTDRNGRLQVSRGKPLRRVVLSVLKEIARTIGPRGWR